ncbi:hypothetical protein P3L10_003691 [Capsicum annuum]
MITKFFKPQTSSDTSPSSSLPSSPLPVNLSSVSDNDKELVKLDLKSDPDERKLITEFSPNIRDRVRRYYIRKKHCQPDKFEFPLRHFGGTPRHFNPEWFKPPYSQWLESSIKEDATFYLCCYLFKNKFGGYGKKVSESFTMEGFQSWNKDDARFDQFGTIYLASLDKQSEKIKGEHCIRLNASIDVTRYFLKQGLSFRGHNECVTSTRRGNFLDLLNFKNSTMTSFDIQKDIVSSCAKETLKAIIEDLNGDFLRILVDESKDVSHKEQMGLVLRYVNKEGKLIERFLGLVHVKDTSAKSLKEAIYSLLLNHSLSLFQIRGKGYDGASNMQGELNGLKTLILKENSSAYCVHCFAHQLQFTLVAVAKQHDDVNNFFDILANILNIFGGSFKSREMLRDDQAEKLKVLLVLGKVHTESRLNQKLGLQRSGDTRWGSHFKIVRNCISLFSSIVHVRGVLEKEGANYHEKALAKSLVEDIRSYEFVYMLHLMLKILVVTYDLNMALQ